MKTFVIKIITSGYAYIEAETEVEALKKAQEMRIDEFELPEMWIDPALDKLEVIDRYEL